MEKARRDFAADAQGAGLRLFYYAGHGVQSEGSNWLLPIDADVKEDYELKTKAFSAQSVLDGLESAGAGVNLVVLDACRDNPFKAVSRSAGASRGLAVMGIRGSFIVYATAPGSTAADGSGRNGLFTECLLSRLDSPGLSLQEIMTNVSADVVAKSVGRQEPWKQDNLTKMVYFVTPDEARARFGARIAEGEAALKAAEAELASLRESSGKEADAAKKQAIELEIKKKAALEAQRRQETEALKAEKERQESAAKAQAQEAAQLASFKSEQATREEAIHKAAEAKRRELESLKSGSGGVSYILAIEAACKAQDELDRQYDDSQAKVTASVSGAFDQKLASLASWTIDPWENDAEFKARVGKERSRLASEKKAALSPFMDAERGAQAGLEAARTVYKGSSVKLDVGAFDRDAKRFPITLAVVDPKLSYKAGFFYSVKSDTSDELKRLYLEFDSWMKTGALFGEVEASVFPAGNGCFVNQVEAVRLRAVDSSGEKLLYEYKSAKPVSLFASSAEQAKPKTFASYLYAIAPGAAISVNGAAAGMLWLDGKQAGWLQGGETRELGDLSPTTHLVEMRYANGKAEQQQLSVRARKKVAASFLYEQQVTCVGWVGNPLDSSTSWTRAVLWKGGSPTVLPSHEKAGKAYASVVAGGDVYTVGLWTLSAGEYAISRPCYWKNGSRVDITAPLRDCKAVGIAVSGGTVYTCGYYMSEKGQKVACYWAGDKKVDLPSGGEDAGVEAIAVSGSSVFAVGWCKALTKSKEKANFPCYWSGGKKFDLATTPNDNNAAIAAAIADGKLYIVGYYWDGSKTCPCLWEGASHTLLPTDGKRGGVNCIAVSDGVLLMAGQYNNGSRWVPCYWIGTGKRVDLPSSSDAEARTISMIGGVVYVGGSRFEKKLDNPCYWRDGKLVDLFGASADSSVRAIYAQE
jgi:uncharacterized caspase-like protein